jgi:hypothetical protein
LETWQVRGVNRIRWTWSEKYPQDALCTVSAYPVGFPESRTTFNTVLCQQQMYLLRYPYIPNASLQRFIIRIEIATPGIPEALMVAESPVFKLVK